MLLSVKMYLALVWGACALFSTESMSASIPGSSSMNSTAEPNMTTKQQNGAHVASNETDTPSASWQPVVEPAKISSAATVPPSVETGEAVIGASNGSAAGSLTTNTGAAATSSSGSRGLHAATAVTRAASGARPAASTAVSETAAPAEGPSRQRPHTTPADVTAPPPAAAAPSATPSAATRLPSTATAGATARFFSPRSTRPLVLIQSLSTPSAPQPTTAKPTSEAAPAFRPTSLPVAINETSAAGGDLSPASRPSSATQFISTAGSSSTAEPPATSFPTDSDITSAATAVSTSPAGVWVPRVPKRLPVQTTTPPRATATPQRAAGSSEAQPCSTRAVARHCLIVIASLAALATVFMVSTIVLCAKLSAKKYKAKRPQQATEMMCISALLPERNHTYTRQRNPVANGVLVIHSAGDSDEDGGDNVTLSSFLPENDRYT